MKLSFILPVVTLLGCFTSSVVAGVPHPAVRRQDGDKSSSTTSSEASSTTADVTNGHSSNGHKTHDPTQASTTHSQPAATASGGSIWNITHPHHQQDGELPLQPVITPAMGVSGAILLLTGVGYALIGIKSAWVYISFSTAYLSSLSITVLIVYVMKPPVSDPIQGAYFVAAFVPGCIIGGVSIIFKEITDKLACVLGGFCMSMWFMTLKEGGLITSSTGKIIFVACMCVGGAALGFSRWTKEHGLIASISFGGATATVLGIDCFSRAGLKEFWIYIWDLNSRAFPIWTETYPITRGMRVELAATIIIFLIGMMSQYKIWRLIKARREKRAQAQKAHEDDLDQMAAAAGVRVEGDNVRDMAHWEAAFEGKGDTASQTISARDSVVDTVRKQSFSVREAQRSLSDTIEMDEMSSSRDPSQADRASEKSRSAKPAPIQVHVIQEDTLTPSEEGHAERSSDAKTDDGAQPQQSGLAVSARTSTERRQSSEGHSTPGLSARNSFQATVPPPPEVVPPPFVVPQHDDNQSDAASTAAASMQGQRNSGRFSIPHGFKRLSGHRHSAMSDSTEALVVPHIEDDRASSVAATLDLENDKSSLPALSAPSSPLPGKTFDLNETDSKQPSEAPVEETGLQSSTSVTEAAPIRLSLNPPSEKDDVDSASKTGDEPSHQKSRDSFVPPAVTNLSGHLPDGLSKVAMTYRTNEWAKHLELAEAPELEDLQESRAVGVSADDPVEPPAPVIIEEPHRSASSQPGIRSTQAHEPSRPVQSRSSRHSFGAAHSTEMVSPVASPPSAAMSQPRRSSSQLNLGGGLSNSSLARRASGPLGASMSGGAADEPRASRQFPSPMPNSTLMGKRNSMMQMRPMSTSFNRLATQPSAADVSEAAPGRRDPSGSPSAAGSLDSEEMPLAHRKSLLDKQQLKSQSRPAHASYQAPVPAPARQNTRNAHNPYQTFDSHQPQREKGIDPARRETMLATWRESVRHDIPTTGNAGAHMTRQPSQQQVAAARRDEMMKEHRREQRQAQKKQALAEQQEVSRHSMMRQGDMLSAHAAAMKRMQASANKKSQQS